MSCRDKGELYIGKFIGSDQFLKWLFVLIMHNFTLSKRAELFELIYSLKLKM